MRRRDLFRPRPRDDLRQRDEPDVSWVEVIVLGLVQGLTEFLPISSSAHLRIVSEVFFGSDAGAAFTAVTQLGTEAAVLIYFARDIGRLTMAWLRGLARREARADPDYRLAWLVILGTLPIGVLGLAFEDQIQTAARNLWLIATTLVVFGVLLGVAERVGRQKVDLDAHDGRAGPHPGAGAGDGADPRRVAVRRHDHRGAVPRADPARGRPVLVPAGDPGRRGVGDLPAARRPHARRPERPADGRGHGDRVRGGLRGDRLAAALRRAPQRLRVRRLPDRARCGAVRRARHRVDLGD